MRTRILIMGFVLGVGITAFQNCSEVQFGGVPASSGKLGGDACRTVQKAEVKAVRIETKDLQIVSCDAGGAEKCAVVCHVPPGNPAAKHTIIVGLPAALGAHSPGSHGGDHNGPCEDGTGNDTDDGTGNDTDDGTGNDTDDGTGNDTDDGTGNDTDDGTGNDTDDGTGNDTDDGTGNDTFDACREL